MEWLKTRVTQSVELWDRYERRLSVIGLATGFIFDLIIANRPDSPTNNVLLLSYLFVSGGLILILNLRTLRKKDVDVTPPLLLLLVLQFCFGGLASNLLILYGRSGTFAGSALFILVLVGMLIGNEFLKSRYAQLRFNIVVYYMLLLTYCIIAVPTFIFHSVGTLVFLASGLVSLVFIGFFLALVYVVVLRGRQRGHQLYEVSFLVGFVFVLFNAFYFLGIIPPVPLSLKNIGVYHSVQKIAPGTYAGVYEDAPWYVFWRDTDNTYTVKGGEKATCFSSVFAPTGLSTPIFHRWEKYDDTKGAWTTISRISFPISGGRGEGYRGWTLSGVTPGRWRCDVETQNGALIGRISFVVVENPAGATISTKTL